MFLSKNFRLFTNARNLNNSKGKISLLTVSAHGVTGANFVKTLFDLSLYLSRVFGINPRTHLEIRNIFLLGEVLYRARVPFASSSLTEFLVNVTARSTLIATASTRCWIT